MSFARCATLFTIFLCTQSLQLSAADESFGEPSLNRPELKQLHRYAGKWEAKLGDSDLTILSTRVWVLDGYFIKHDFEVGAGTVRGTMYKGYDTQKNQYTLTILDSQGNQSLLTGDWNEDLKTFQFKAINNTSPIQEYESYFADEKTEQWTIVHGSETRAQLSGLAKRVAP